MESISEVSSFTGNVRKGGTMSVNHFEGDEIGELKLVANSPRPRRVE